MAKKRLSKEDIIMITDSEQNFENMEKLIEYIKDDPNAKRLLRNFLEKEGALFKKLDERLEYLENNYYIDGEEVASMEVVDITEKSVQNNYEIENCSFEAIKSSFEEKDYMEILAEDEATFSSQEIQLTENSVIEIGQVVITWYGEKKLDCNRVLLAEKGGNRMFALGHLVAQKENENKYWMIFDNKNWIMHSDMENEKQVRIIVYTMEDGKMHSQKVDFRYIKMLIENDKPLCIDFGTSNTTVGTYGIKSKVTGMDEDDIVKFVDVTVNPHNTNVMMMPTVVYVKSVDCDNPEKSEFLFGYEALKLIEQEKHFEFKASVFYEIKRWMLVPTKLIKICDHENNTVEIERKLIIKAYIDYIIELSEQYFGRRFKKIHFSAPVKLKSLFISTFKDLYKGNKEVLDEKESIDEAFAIVYNHIMDIIDKEKKNIEKKTVFIIDCGGGTTDLATCTFSYKHNEDFSECLEYETCFTNGNSNFGGNNITYRIMQLLKIKISEKYCEDDTIICDAKELIDKSEDEILNTIDDDREENYNSDYIESKVYKDFVSMYKKCELIIPTCFADEKDLTDRKRKQRNFFYMWKLAERIKIEFFSTDQVRIEFGKEDMPIPLKVDTKDDYFFVNSSGRLEKKLDPLKNIVITNKDVERVICGDIYGLLLGLIKEGDLEDDLKITDFNYYKLSGQSCKISMFKELLKEYIPGRKLRTNSGTKTQNNNSERLKMECLQGCIQYIRDQRGHEFKVVENHKKPRMIYDVYIKNQHASDEIIFNSKAVNSQEIKLKYFNVEADEMYFDVKNESGVVEKTIEMCLEDRNIAVEYYNSSELVSKIEDASGVEKEYICPIIQKICDEEDDLTDSGKKVLFAMPSADNYGVVLILIQMKKEDNTTKYKLINRKHCSFENPDKTFFDGRR